MSSRLFAFLFAFFIAAAASAQHLPTTVTPTHYDLRFSVDIPHARFDGTETIHVTLKEPTTIIVLNAAEIAFRTVTVRAAADTQTASVKVDDKTQQATLSVSKRLPAGAADIHIEYSGILNDQLRGFYLSKGKERNYAVTQFESVDARRAFPCFDEPSFKATFAITMVIARGDRAISNGKVVSDVAGPLPTEHTVTFAPTAKMSSYLVAMAVGDFQCSEGAADAIPIRVCATPDKKDLTRIALESAQQILHFYDTWYAIKYPFTKLDVVAVPDFAAGAMENTGAIFYRETDLLADTKTASVSARKTIASVLAHEMAHQWFGDLVTMAWWDDIWLNEGFATWMANKPLAALHPDWNMAVDEAVETQTALNLDSLRATRPIHQDAESTAQIDELFDAIAYEKGAAVLRMIENYVGEEAFRKGVNSYLQAHAYGNATSEDLWKSIASASGKPIDRILPTFVNQSGAPLIAVAALTCDQAKSSAQATFRQERFMFDAGRESARERWIIPVCTKVQGSTTGGCYPIGDQEQRIEVAKSCPSWIFANAGARGYYRTEYPPTLLHALASDVQTRLNAPERLSLIDDEWAMVRAKRHSISDYLTLAEGYGREHTNGVLGEVVNRFGFIREYLATAQNRARFETFTRRLFRPLLDEVGFAPSPSDNDDRRGLRATVIDTLGTIGNDPDVVSQARATVDRMVAGQAVDQTLARAVVPIAAAHGDTRLFDALLAASGKAASPEEQYRYLYALADFEEPALIDRALALSTTPQIRSQDAAIYLGRFLENPAARDRAWTFVTAHWTELASKVTVSGGDTRIVSATGAFCDATHRDAVTAFFAAHPLPGVSRTLDQAVERINNCIALRESQSAVLGRWLEQLPTR